VVARKCVLTEKKQVGFTAAQRVLRLHFLAEKLSITPAENEWTRVG